MDNSIPELSTMDNNLTNISELIGKLSSMKIPDIKSNIDEIQPINNKLTLNQAVELARKWLPPISDDDKKAVMNILTGTEVTYGTKLLRKYIELLRPYADILGIRVENNCPREADCAASGLVFFYGCLFYIMHFPNWGQHIEDIFLYNLLYILVDHYIDDIKIDPKLKDKAISQMYILIMNPDEYKRIDLADPVLKTIAQIYQKLLIRCPNVKSPLIKLFQTEIDGLTIQKDRTLDREIYYDIALKKGGYTMEVLQYIVGDDDPTISEATFHCGTIMQLIDDLLDFSSDQKNGINTIATYDLEHEGNLDNLWIDVMTRIGAIDTRFTIFIILYTVFAIYIPDRAPENYTSTLRILTNPLNLFDCDGSSLLIDAIMAELTIMEIFNL